MSTGRLLLAAAAALALLSSANGTRQGRDSYLDAYMASHGSATGPPAAASGPGPTYLPSSPSSGAYGPPHRGYPPPSPPAPSYGPPPNNHLHHLHHHHGQVFYATAPDYGMTTDGGNGNGNGEGNGNGGVSGGVHIATFMHALGKLLVVKLIVKLVAAILALLILPKIKEKKKRRPSGNNHKPHHRPQMQDEEEDEEDEEEEDDDEDEDDDERAITGRSGRAVGGHLAKRKAGLRSAILHSIETSSWDPRLLDLADRVFQGVQRWSEGAEEEEGAETDEGAEAPSPVNGTARSTDASTDSRPALAS